MYQYKLSHRLMSEGEEEDEDEGAEGRHVAAKKGKNHWELEANGGKTKWKHRKQGRQLG